jgi:hypothetical protein
MSFGGPFLLAPVSSLLGIRPGMTVALHHPPDGFIDALFPLPEGASIVPDAKTGLDVQVLFAVKKTEVVERLAPLTRGMAVLGSIWVCFPPESNLLHVPTEDFVRVAALELGLTDTKKVLLDPAWEGLRLQWKPRSLRADLPSVRA